jgi:hypothetical protein
MIAVGAFRPFRSFRCRRRGLRRALGWFGVAAVVPVLFACTARSFERPAIVPDVGERDTVTVTVNRNVDLLFLIDDSSSMAKSQDNLRRNFPAFMTALKNLPDGLPNVHIAVISSDMGAGDGSFDSCGATGGKNGVFQYTARGTCTATNLEPSATYISDIGGVRNYNGDLEDVFSCIAALGEGGCGFEHQFAAITRALGADGQPPPAQNQGFLRDDAYLAIVMITNEDDCSAPPGSLLYDRTANTTLADPFGPDTGFRCNEFGHLCDGARPSRLAPNGDVNATQTYASCVSAEDGVLVTVAETAARIKALKRDPANQVMVAAITGPESPYTVHWEPATVPDSGPWPKISHACTAADGSYADPSPRTSALVRQFGGNGLQLSICAGEFAPALDRIAEKIRQHFARPCITGRVAKKAGTNSDDCTVVSTSSDGDGRIDERPVAACADTGGAGPCWQLAAGEDQCTGQTIQITPDPAAPARLWETAAIECALCVAGASDPSRGCP